MHHFLLNYIYIDHLTELSKSFDKYYPNDEEIAKEDWIRDPFAAKDLPENLFGEYCPKNVIFGIWPDF